MAVFTVSISTKHRAVSDNIGTTFTGRRGSKIRTVGKT